LSLPYDAGLVEKPNPAGQQAEKRNADHQCLQAELEAAAGMRLVGHAAILADGRAASRGAGRELSVHWWRLERLAVVAYILGDSESLLAARCGRLDTWRSFSQQPQTFCREIVFGGRAALGFVMPNQPLAFERIKLILDMFLESCYRPAEHLVVVSGVAQSCDKVAFAFDRSEENFLLVGWRKIVHGAPEAG
jgi:hypothetical protein